MQDKIIDVLLYALPSIVTGLVAYYFFLRLSKSEDSKNKFLLLTEDKKIALPVRLQAYERMTLVMERINPTKLLIRITPTSEDKDLYVQKLLTSIEQEFEHNLSQQIYISDECWNVLVTARTTTNNLIKKVADDVTLTSAQNLREAILKSLLNKPAPSATGIAFIKEEVKLLF